uniref:Uncharacterized protein n=1 Tax=Paulinella longichromatophora TaxID=1708747 RepID=A0A2H4ZP71_9EUKA|nr:hypothetical protein PLO_337 [Paulinella longichromatophora]
MALMANLDLAFEIECKEYLREPWANSIDGHQLWQNIFSYWLSELERELLCQFHVETYSLGLKLVNDIQIGIINRTWRGIDLSTDVLSFPMHECLIINPMKKTDLQKSISIELGDIIISIETAERQSIDHNHSLEHELHWLASHGLLHLLGLDHPDQESLNRMLNYQDKLLSKTYN